jgi:uncharacterized circularly permuted ATP-grasp superfamily protein
MTEALRQGSISMVNALGSGILETRARLPPSCRAVRGPAWRAAAAAHHRHLVVRQEARAPHVATTSMR